MVNSYGPNESIDSLLRRFKVEVEKQGIMNDYKKHEYYIAPSLKRHIKSVEQKRKYALLRKQNKEGGDNR